MFYNVHNGATQTKGNTMDTYTENGVIWNIITEEANTRSGLSYITATKAGQTELDKCPTNGAHKMGDWVKTSDIARG